MIIISIVAVAVVVVIACASVTALTWILIGAEVEERKRRKEGK